MNPVRFLFVTQPVNMGRVLSVTLVALHAKKAMF
jgi:hypothetical protein